MCDFCDGDHEVIERMIVGFTEAINILTFDDA